MRAPPILWALPASRVLTTGISPPRVAPRPGASNRHRRSSCARRAAGCRLRPGPASTSRGRFEAASRRVGISSFSTGCTAAAPAAENNWRRDIPWRTPQPMRSLFCGQVNRKYASRGGLAIMRSSGSRRPAPDRCRWWHPPGGGAGPSSPARTYDGRAAARSP